MMSDNFLENRFYPSFASISTHFLKLRATAVGIAIAGSGVGEWYATVGKSVPEIPNQVVWSSLSSFGSSSLASGSGGRCEAQASSSSSSELSAMRQLAAAFSLRANTPLPCRAQRSSEMFPLCSW